MNDINSSERDEAIEKFNTYRSNDPFPDIEPALLNSADIYDYIKQTGMINPFHPEDLKAASYALRLQGKCIYWNNKKKKQIKDIKFGDEFTLESDSIAFVSLEPLIQLPDYIAARFNLKIDNVYRGLLLGTGPLVDPGYIGYLSIPFHNLTSNDYKFRGGDQLIWMEFTKLSKNARWILHNSISAKAGKYVENTKFSHTKIRRVHDFLREAEPHRSVQSSIPLSVKKSEKEAKKASRKTTVVSGTAIAIFIALATALYSTYGGYIEFATASYNKMSEIDNKLSERDSVINDLKKKLNELKIKLEALEK